MSLIEEISTSLRIDTNFLFNAVEKDAKRVKISQIPKRNGRGFRKIYVAPKSHRIIQYYIISEYLGHISYHSAATAYTRGKNIKNNVQPHSKYTFLTKIDFKNFFPSITFSDIKNKLENIECTQSLLSNYEDIKLIKKTCFDQDGRLCIGYPISPVLSNIAMHGIDNEIEAILQDTYGYNEFSFTRYADDITIGVDKKGDGKNIVEAIDKILSETKSPKLSINSDKTRLYNRNVGNGIITGLRICQDGRVKLPRQKRDHIRLLLSLYAKGELNPEEHSTLLGLINYARSVDAEFATKLNMKFSEEIEKLKSN